MTRELVVKMQYLGDSRYLICCSEQEHKGQLDWAATERKRRVHVCKMPTMFAIASAPKLDPNKLRAELIQMRQDKSGESTWLAMFADASSMVVIMKRELKLQNCL